LRSTGTTSVAVVVVLGAAGLFGLGACSDSGSDRQPSPAVTTTMAGVAPTSVVTTVAAGAVTVRGTVLTVFASARVLQLDPPVDGYSKVALTADTEFRRADGSPGSLADVAEGSTVEVSGEAAVAAPATVIARRVVVVG
jgi:hypothetical protein